MARMREVQRRRKDIPSANSIQFMVVHVDAIKDLRPLQGRRANATPAEEAAVWTTAPTTKEIGA